MPWYHHIAAFLHHNLPQMRATRRTNLALLTAAILNRRALSLSELARPWMPGLPQSHHQRKKRHFRFLSNPSFDPIQTQCALMPAICQLAGLKGQTPIMIDWSDLGRKRIGLFAAVCYRKRGLPLLSWATTHDELTPSQNRLEETFIARLLRNLPDNIRPLLLADRGFGRASLLRRLQEMPRHTGRTVDYVVRLKGNVHIQTADGYQGLLRNYPLRPNRYVFLPGVRYRSDGVVTVNLALYWGRGHREPWYLATSLPDAKVAVAQYRKRMQPEQYFRDGKQYFALDRGTAKTTARLGRMLVGLLLACCLLLLAGRRASWRFRRRVCSWGKLGLLRLGMECYLATPEPPLRWFGLPTT